MSPVLISSAAAMTPQTGDWGECEQGPAPGSCLALDYIRQIEGELYPADQGGNPPMVMTPPRASQVEGQIRGVDAPPMAGTPRGGAAGVNTPIPPEKLVMPVLEERLMPDVLPGLVVPLSVVKDVNQDPAVVTPNVVPRLAAPAVPLLCLPLL